MNDNSIKTLKDNNVIGVTILDIVKKYTLNGMVNQMRFVLMVTVKSLREIILQRDFILNSKLITMMEL